jgi:hypothetical protein
MTPPGSEHQHCCIHLPQLRALPIGLDYGLQSQGTFMWLGDYEIKTVAYTQCVLAFPTGSRWGGGQVSREQ